MALFTDSTMVEQALAMSFAALGLATTWIVQCGSKKRTPPKKVPPGGAGSKSTRSTSAKSKRSGKSKRSSRSSKSSKSSKRSASSKRGAGSKRVAPSGDKKSKSKRSSVLDSSGKKRSSTRSSRSSKLSDNEVATTRPARKAKTDMASIKSLQEMQKLPPTQPSAEEPPQKRNVAAASNNNQPPQQPPQQQPVLGLTMEPRELRFSKQGGLLKVALHNTTDERQAIKVKCSDNNLYRVNPVYGFVEPGNTLNVFVMRQNGASKLDKIVFVTAKAPADETDLKQIFKKSPNEYYPMIVLPLLA